MKKILFASTALVAAGLFTTGTASASDKIQLQLGGFSKWWVVGSWQSSSYAAATGSNGNGASYDNVDLKGDNEVWFGGNTTLDNGMKVGVDVHLEAGGHTDMTTDTIDLSYVYVEGGFGKFLLGTQKNGTYLLHVRAPDAAGNNSEGGIMTGGYTIVRPSSVNGMAGGNTTAIDTTNNSEAITYVAPTFYGLTVGGSYLPHGGNEDYRGQPNLNAVTSANGYTTGVIQQVYGAGALYANTFGGVGVKVSAGAVTAQLDGTVGGRWLEQAYGTQLSYAGFTLGGSYRDQKHILSQGGTDVASLGDVSEGVSGSFGSGQAWDVGLQYATGPYAVSFNTYYSTVQHSDTQDGHDHTVFYQVSGKYNLGAGVDILASAGYAEFNSSVNDTAAATTAGGDPNHNSGWTVMSGLSLTF